MADVIRTTREPMLGQIRLAWWRERLEELDKGLPPAAEPRLRAVAEHVLPQGASGAETALPEGAWIGVLTTPFPWNREIVGTLASRGVQLFSNAGRLLGCSSEQLSEAGALWAIVDFARHCSDETSRRLLIDEARRRAQALRGARFLIAQRPLTSLTALAMRDLRHGEPFELEGARGRALAVLKHSLSGRLPRFI